MCPWSPAVCISHFHDLYVLLVPAGYGFVDFDSPASAQKAVTALKAGGVQAQMAKVRSQPEVTIIGGFISNTMLVRIKSSAH